MDGKEDRNRYDDRSGDDHHKPSWTVIGVDFRKVGVARSTRIILFKIRMEKTPPTAVGASSPKAAPKANGLFRQILKLILHRGCNLFVSVRIDL
jgi:hypothetical protein